MKPIDIAYEDVLALQAKAPEWDSHWANVLVEIGFDNLATQRLMWLLAKGVKRKRTITELDVLVNDPAFTALDPMTKSQYCRVAVNLCKRIPVTQLSNHADQWEHAGENLRNRRYPNIITCPDGRIYFEEAHTEYYYNPIDGTVQSLSIHMELNNRPILYLPDIPFEAHYADPFARVPIQGIPTDYAAHVRDTVINPSTVRLTYNRATSVARCANNMVRSKALYGRVDLSIEDYFKHSRIPCPTLIREAVRYALNTYPMLPYPCGEFTPVPTLVESLDGTHWELTSYYDVVWTPTGFPKATLRLSYDDYYQLNVVYRDDDRPIKSTNLKEIPHAKRNRR